MMNRTSVWPIPRPGIRPRVIILVIILVGMVGSVLAGLSPETAVALISSGALLAAETATRLLGPAPGTRR
ncbi:hypothetical protein L6E12_27015 [Actinokineospora sp. PR83]|uniref:hypothetical protein n=1 Tax=Actinokineospora sp. PR83 TaxID=2884908 RepID=UPI001F329798|nr:hypothetical protein [Actinokineospora sp. PR83]MCG8919432.1 hypothetical protein [Actinokineospora sp. PR83]